MTLLSVCVVTKNEEQNIERCLSSVSFADEIVVVDSGSTDRTVAICKRFTDRVYYRQWPGFGPQKDFAFSLARGEWVLSIDADEVVPPELQRRIEAIVRNPSSFSGYYLKRKNFIGNIWVKYGGPFKNYPDWSLRLFHKNKGNTKGDLVHESMVVAGRKGRLDEPILHHAHRDIQDFTATMDYYAGLSALHAYQKRKSAGHVSRLLSIILRPVIVFAFLILIRRAYLSGFLGFRLAFGQALYVLKKYRYLDSLYREFGNSEIPKDIIQAILTPGGHWPIK